MRFDQSGNLLLSLCQCKLYVCITTEDDCQPWDKNSKWRPSRILDTYHLMVSAILLFCIYYLKSLYCQLLCQRTKEDQPWDSVKVETVPRLFNIFNIVLTFYQRSNGQLWDSNVKLTWFYVQCCRSFNVVVMCILQKGIKKETWSKWRPSSTQIKQNNKVMYCCSNIYSYDLERTYLLLTICIDSQE